MEPDRNYRLNETPRLSHTSEQLLAAPPSRSTDLFSSKAFQDQGYTHEITGINADPNLDRTRSLEFVPESGDPDTAFISEYEAEEEEEEFDAMLNFVNPDMKTRIRMYLKPKDASPCLLVTLVLLDTCLAIIYIAAQFSYVLQGNYIDD